MIEGLVGVEAGEDLGQGLEGVGVLVAEALVELDDDAEQADDAAGGDEAGGVEAAGETSDSVSSGGVTEVGTGKPFAGSMCSGLVASKAGWRR